ncbi:MAG: serine/threonine-protein kinase [Acidobacteriota bacterium]
MTSPTPVGSTPATGGSLPGRAALPPKLLDDAAQRMSILAVFLAVVVVIVQVFQRTIQPQLVAVIDDPVNRLATLAAVLMAIGLFALQRLRLATSRTLLGLGMLFEVVVALAISMFETSRPFDPVAPLLGLSALGPWIVFVGALIPNRPIVTLAVALVAATSWPVAYLINSARLGFVTESWRQTAVWPAMNYLMAVLAYLVGRRTYGTACQAQTAQELGSYRLVSLIGEGGMGEVWKASHRMLARPAAIKLVKPDGAASARQADVFVRRFRREANMIAGLQSPHTVYLYDFGTAQDGRFYYVMELLDGISLQTLVTTFGPQPASRVIFVLRQICSSLDEAHEQGLVHRDLKPSNVMLCTVARRHDFVKVLDFGLAKSVARPERPDVSQLTIEGVAAGTPGYIAPEVALGDADVDARADLYALGCVAYVLLTGTLVFPDPNPLSMTLKHVQTVPDRPSVRTELPVPPDLERIILRCLEKKRTDRPGSARELDEMLASCSVPGWTERNAHDWWQLHLPQSSSLRSFAQEAPRTPPVVQKV